MPKQETSPAPELPKSELEEIQIQTNDVQNKVSSKKNLYIFIFMFAMFVNINQKKVFILIKYNSKIPTKSIYI